MRRKVTTAEMDRMESLGTPHTPWPEVQPLASFVPKPTRNPANPKLKKEMPAAGN